MLLASGKLPMFPFQDFGIDPAGLNVLAFVLFLNISFSGNMSQMMKMQDLQNIQIFLQQLAVTAQLNPQVLDLINLDAAMKENSEILGISPDIINPAEVVEAIREQRAQQQMQQEQLAMESQALDNRIKEKEAGFE